jgi:hypothetical protein
LYISITKVGNLEVPEEEFVAEELPMRGWLPALTLKPTTEAV